MGQKGVDPLSGEYFSHGCDSDLVKDKRKYNLFLLSLQIRWTGVWFSPTKMIRDGGEYEILLTIAVGSGGDCSKKVERLPF